MSNRQHRRRRRPNPRRRTFTNGHRHDLVDAMRCADCREEAVDAAVDSPVWVQVIFNAEPEPGERGTPYTCADPRCPGIHYKGPLVGTTVIPSWSTDIGDAIRASIVADANPGPDTIPSFRTVPRRVILRAKVPLFELVTGPGATAALDAIDAAATELDAHPEP